MPARLVEPHNRTHLKTTRHTVRTAALVAVAAALALTARQSDGGEGGKVEGRRPRRRSAAKWRRMPLSTWGTISADPAPWVILASDPYAWAGRDGAEGSHRSAAPASNFEHKLHTTLLQAGPMFYIDPCSTCLDTSDK
ncbi:hypothetical protein GCM10009680_62380 [Streptomyces yatensis]|uniref:Uncharacterized protein n=1 Tax=Streptomyces yatensis TaxID=155177 RepID=A0ABN2IVU0_9ACTN